jgi:hypothetical protein
MSRGLLLVGGCKHHHTQLSLASREWRRSGNGVSLYCYIALCPEICNNDMVHSFTRSRPPPPVQAEAQVAAVQKLADQSAARSDKEVSVLRTAWLDAEAEVGRLMQELEVSEGVGGEGWCGGYGKGLQLSRKWRLPVGEPRGAVAVLPYPGQSSPLSTSE